ncbi:MAG: RtcB family protein [Chitinophagaceae bacterium]|nr:RtcB family protein [Chitinophagaceae bacterium]MBL0336041.1 RtcB family protein [Chitinophagaceae bacterium]
MASLQITGKELRAIGFPEGPVISVTMALVKKQFKHGKKEEVMELLKKVLAAPVEYENDAVFALIAEKLLPKKNTEGAEISLNNQGIPFSIFGSANIEEGAMHQMYMAAKLPVAVAGALMPDAHAGYGLPIGGVLAVKNAVIPYGVGVDIGCRMCMSLFDIPATELAKKESFFVRELGEATLFGSGAQYKEAEEHEVMDNPLFYEMPLLKNLHGRAWKQLGTSGSGNHFVEFGEVEITSKDEILGVEPGTYLGLLSHSGSRGLGAQIAGYYTRLAISKRRLAQEAKNLAWLTMDEEEGIEYWLAMNLAGEYAKACHDIIHRKIARQIGRKPIRIVENHHNFAWKEMVNGEELIVHRKGATPAGKNVLGIIPGSMTAAGYIVKGKGETTSLDSASHGAGRKMSRSNAMKSITQDAMNHELKKHGVKLLGGGLDEAPFAYKDIDLVMKSQEALVDIVGKFTPKIVKMAGTSPKPWMKD